jgi:hypothetical protein
MYCNLPLLKAPDKMGKRTLNNTFKSNRKEYATANRDKINDKAVGNERFLPAYKLTN